MTLKKEKARIGICSFSEKWDHELMWAHYTDGFRGICIAYNFEKLMSGLPGDCEFTRILYDENPPPLESSQEDEVETAKNLLSTKNHRWLYEREWRLFATAVGKTEYNQKGCAERIYLGARMPDAFKMEIKNEWDKMGVPFVPTKIEGYSIEKE